MGAGGGVAAQELGYPEVGQQQVFIAVEQNILGLEVAVDDPLIVGIGQRIGQIQHDAAHLCPGHVCPDALGQISPFDIFHDQVMTPVVQHAAVINGNNVGVLESG